MRSLLASPLGFLIGLALGALGGGGSILAVPVLVYAAGQSAVGATASSLVIVGATSIGGMISHLKGHRVRIGKGIVFGLTGVGGSILGTTLNKHVNPQLLLLTFSGVMVIAAWQMYSRSTKGTTTIPKPPSLIENHPSGQLETLTKNSVSVSTAIKVVLVGSVVGFMTGFFGVGGGFVVVPGLVLALGFSMADAVGTSLLVIAINSAVALLSRIATAHVAWHIAIPFTIAGILGSLLGAKIASKTNSAKLTKAFVWLLLALAAYTAIQSSLALHI